jgi:16S rRNA (guanine966-N2)-methyltransferase
MRIIAGKFRSRILEAPKGEATRPTSDRARESLFNVLAHSFQIEDAQVLDLFAGSGALGFEALSRGAAHITFVEKHRAALAAIELNRDSFGLKNEVSVVKTDVYDWLKTARGEFELVFADPPYDDPRTLADLPAILFASRLLTARSLVIVEHRVSSAVIPPPSVEVVKEIKAGEAHFTLLRRETTTN